MLKAYSYAEEEQVHKDIVDPELFEQEIRIITDFALRNPTPKEVCDCIICGGKTKEFATIKGVYYQRCLDCFSIFAVVKKEIIHNYKNHAELIAFRQSDQYQHSASDRRSRSWEDFLFWLSFRLSRFLPNIKAVDIIDVDNRYNVLSERIKEAEFCGSYNEKETADVILFLEQLRCDAEPISTLQRLRSKLNDDGLLIISTRVGSGFDVLTLKDCIDNICPYESVFLPSIEGLCFLLKKSGYKVLEISTPGTLDVQHVLKNKHHIDSESLFIDYLIRKSDKLILAEFQRFLQKSGISSHARVIARKDSSL